MEGHQVLAAQQTAEQQAAAAKKGGFSNNGLGNQVHKPVPFPPLPSSQQVGSGGSRNRLGQCAAAAATLVHMHHLRVHFECSSTHTCRCWRLMHGKIGLATKATASSVSCALIRYVFNPRQ